MTTLKHLLSDKFVEFSASIGEVHKEIKELTTEFQTKVKALREKADTLRADFEAWEKEQEGSPKTAPKTEEPPVVNTTVPGEVHRMNATGGKKA